MHSTFAYMIFDATVIEYLMAVNPVLSFCEFAMSGMAARWDIWTAAHPNWNMMTKAA